MRQQLEQWDPFRLGDKPKYKKFVMILLYIAIGAIVLSLFLYLVLGIFSDRNAKLALYNKKVKEWKKKGESAKLSDISVALKIMPSENTQGNILRMKYQTEDLLKERKLNRVYNYSQAYFFHTNTSMYFPIFHFIRPDVPVGDSEVYCVHLFWTAKENEKVLELYDSIRAFPQCSKAFNPRVIWHEHDPKYGVEVHTWTQEMRELKGCTTKETCQAQCDKYEGIAKKTQQKGYVCYTYKVLTDICLTISYNNTDTWYYSGGCFEDSSPTRMVTAKPGDNFTFENIRVQVRSIADPYVVATMENTESEDFSFGIDIDFMYTFAFLVLFVAILCGVVVSAAVILKEFIFQTQLYEKFFKDAPLQPQSTGRSSDA